MVVGVRVGGDVAVVAVAVDVDDDDAPVDVAAAFVCVRQ